MANVPMTAGMSQLIEARLKAMLERSNKFAETTETEDELVCLCDTLLQTLSVAVLPSASVLQSMLLFTTKLSSPATAAAVVDSLLASARTVGAARWRLCDRGKSEGVWQLLCEALALAVGAAPETIGTPSSNVRSRGGSNFMISKFMSSSGGGAIRRRDYLADQSNAYEDGLDDDDDDDDDKNNNGSSSSSASKRRRRRFSRMDDESDEETKEKKAVEAAVAAAIESQRKVAFAAEHLRFFASFFDMEREQGIKRGALASLLLLPDGEDDDIGRTRNEMLHIVRVEKLALLTAACFCLAKDDAAEQSSDDVHILLCAERIFRSLVALVVHVESGRSGELTTRLFDSLWKAFNALPTMRARSFFVEALRDDRHKLPLLDKLVFFESSVARTRSGMQEVPPRLLKFARYYRFVKFNSSLDIFALLMCHIALGLVTTMRDERARGCADSSVLEPYDSQELAPVPPGDDAEDDATNENSDAADNNGKRERAAPRTWLDALRDEAVRTSTEGALSDDVTVFRLDLLAASLEELARAQFTKREEA
jgi:hypothetical protein